MDTGPARVWNWPNGQVGRAYKATLGVTGRGGTPREATSFGEVGDAVGKAGERAIRDLPTRTRPVMDDDF